MTGFGLGLFQRERADLQVMGLGGQLGGEHGARMK